MNEFFWKKGKGEYLNRLMQFDIEYFFSSGFWVTSRYALVSVLGIVLTVAFARLGTKELYGQYQATLALIGVLSVFSLPGLNIAALKAVTFGEDGAIKKTVRYSFLASLMAVPLILGYSLFVFFGQGDKTYALALGIAAVFFPFSFAPNTWYVFYEGRLSFRPVAYRIFAMTVCLTGALGTLLFLKVGLPVLILTYFSVQTLFQWFFLWEMHQQINQEMKTTIFDFKYGLSVTWQKFVFLIGENLPVLAISFLFGFASLAIFQIAYFFVNALSGLLSGLSATYMPLFFRNPKVHSSAPIIRQLALGAVFFGVFRILIEACFLFIYGENYRESFELVKILSYLVLLLPLKTFLVSYYTATQKNSFLVFVYLTANVLALSGLYILRESSMLWGATLYLYTLNLLILAPLLGAYFLKKE